MDDKLIMLVEDNPDHQELTIQALRDNDFTAEIVVAADGEQALDMLFGNNNTTIIRPNLILLDLKLPKIDGIGVLKAIRGNEDTRRLPVIILTTSLEESDVAASYDGGANSYLRKQVNYRDFVDQIGYMVTYWFVCNHEGQ